VRTLVNRHASRTEKESYAQLSQIPELTVAFNTLEQARDAREIRARYAREPPTR